MDGERGDSLGVGLVLGVQQRSEHVVELADCGDVGRDGRELELVVFVGWAGGEPVEQHQPSCGDVAELDGAWARAGHIRLERAGVGGSDGV